MAVQEPNKIPRPFASKGSYETVPDSTTIYGHASWQKGFPSETALALSEGGIPPRWMDFQGIFHDITEHICYLQKGSHYKWDASVDYPVGAMVVGSDGKLYVSLRESGPTVSGSAINPVGDSSGYWQSFNVTDYVELRNISDSTSATGTAAQGKVASQKAVSDVKKIADDAKSSADAKLPLSGGTMTGAIISMQPGFINRNADNTYLEFRGGTTYSKGAYLNLIGKDCTSKPAGSFNIVANDGETQRTLHGKPDGTLTWNNKKVTLEGDCLPLSGGTMTGNLTGSKATDAWRITNTNNAQSLSLYGGDSYAKGANIFLYGEDNEEYAGSFTIRASTTQVRKALIGKPDGTLRWNSKQITTEGDCIPFSVYNNSTYNIDGSNTYDSLFPYHASSVASSPFRYKYINLDGKDFNSLTVMGGYHVVWYTTFTDSDSTVHTQTLNAPITPASNTMDGILIVEGLGSAAYISSYARVQQTLYCYTSVYSIDSSHTRIFKRRGYLKDGSWSWSVWKEYSTPSMDIGTELLYPSESGSGWIRYSNGIQMCWGRSKGATASGGSTWTLPKAFKDTNFRVIGTACGSDNKNGVVFNTISTTTSTVVFKCISIYDGNTSHDYSGVYAHYLAIGYWK